MIDFCKGVGFCFVVCLGCMCEDVNVVVDLLFVVNIDVDFGVVVLC